MAASAAKRPGHQARDRGAQHFCRRGAAAGLHACVFAQSRAGDPR